ncbi:MAG: hypothetical protein QNJ98_02785 [Planctomycetota bacterium]|nr:hypothetical protein [Planctomycetota bacterium]
MNRKITIAIVFVAVFGISIAFAAVASSETPQATDASVGPVALETNTESHKPCQLLVELCPESVLDRGALTTIDHGEVLVGSYRYWDEAGGSMLYVYDEVGNLITRVRNPQSVVALGPASPQS